MAKDWITGRSWNTGGGGGSPFAMAAIGLLQALQNNRREDERKEEYERMMQEKKAMQEIQTGRTLMERIAQMDPALWGDQGFVDAWKAGDTTYPAKIGWKPPVQAEEVDYEKQVRQSAYRKQASGEPLSEDERILIGLSNKQPTMADLVKLGEGDMIANPRTKETVIKNQRTAKPAVGGGGSGGGGGGGGGSVVRTKGADWIQKNADVHPITGQPFPDGKTHVIFVNRLNPTEVKIGPAILIGSATPDFDIEEELRKVPPKEPGTLSKLWGAAKSLFADDDEEDIAKIRSALQ